mgnify:CR=1 FL=1
MNRPHSPSKSPAIPSQREDGRARPGAKLTVLVLFALLFLIVFLAGFVRGLG